MVAKRFQHVVEAHKPGGYRLLERKMRCSDGRAVRTATITCKPINSPHMVAVFLHEVGHVRNGHVSDSIPSVPTWRMEYEADQFAIAAMKAEGIPFPRATLRDWKEMVRSIIEADKSHEPVDDEVLRYAYGKHWRQHK